MASSESSHTTSTVATSALTSEQSSELQGRLEDLPRELYDIIQKFSFKAFIETRSKACAVEDCDLENKTHVKQFATHLKILHLSRATRARYAKAFYQRRTFTFKDSHFFDSPFLLSVPREHLPLVKGLVFEFAYLGPTWSDPLEQAMYHNVQTYYGDRVAAKVRVKFYMDITGDNQRIWC